MRQAWTKFSGIRPRIDPRLLPEGNAQTADNVFVERGGVRPMQGTQLVTALQKTGVQTIYRFGQASSDPTQYWFCWTTDVDVVKGPIANDTEERTYWTGDGAPKYTTAALGTAGSDLPSSSRPLGVPAPTTATTLGPYVVDPGITSTGQDTRTYVYTFVTDKGEESAPSLPATLTIQTGQGVTLSALETAASNAAVLSKKRIYRAERGQYLFVAEIDAATTTYNDTVSPDLLGEVCPSIDWDTPPASMFGLVAGVNGILAAADGYNAMFCEPYRPHTWPQKYSRALDFPIVGVSHFGQSFVFLTTGFPAVLTGAHPANLSQESPAFYQPCVSKRSIVTTGDDVVYASPDGLCAIGVNGPRVLTEGLFLPADWRSQIKPESLLGSWHEGYYVGFYTNDAGSSGFMFNPVTQDWINLPGLTATARYRDTVTDALYVCVGDQVHKWRAGADLSYTWKSAELPTPLMDFAAGRVTGDYPVTFKLYRDGVVRLTKTISSDEPFKLPAGLGRSWAVEVSGSSQVLGIVLATGELEA